MLSNLCYDDLCYIFDPRKPTEVVPSLQAIALVSLDSSNSRGLDAHNIRERLLRRIREVLCKVMQIVIDIFGCGSKTELGLSIELGNDILDSEPDIIQQIHLLFYRLCKMTPAELYDELN